MIHRFISFLLLINVVLCLECTKSVPGSCLYNLTCSYEKEKCNSSLVSNIRGGIYCTTIIQRIDDGILIGNMGCMYDQETTKRCLNQTECQMTFTNKDKEFSHCCCDQDLCNLNFTLANDQLTFLNDQNVGCERIFCKWRIVMIMGLIIFGLLFVLIIFGLFNRRKLVKRFTRLNGLCQKCQSSKEKSSSSPNEKEKEKEKECLIPTQISFVDLHLEENVIKRGRFSSIYCGLYNGNRIACKILSDQNKSGEAKKLFDNEKEIYSLPMMSHTNILKYYGHWENEGKYYLITSLSFNGSLRDVLQSRLIRDEKELFWICESISRGVEYLHKDFRRRDLTKSEDRSPIAHRDLKSENILYLNENEIVICDFAMSIELDQNENYPNEQQQIGTARYMSPEILAGTIGWEPLALLRCDVYALGLIFWEVLSRCATEDCDLIYQMPYEEQLKEIKCFRSPDVSDMLQIVNSKYLCKRPMIKSSWRNSTKSSINLLIKTMEECWDENPDSRISAASASSRLNNF